MKKNVYDRRLVEQILVHNLEEKFDDISIDEGIEILLALKERFSEFKNLTIKYYCFYESSELQLFGSSPENDNEYNKRIRIYERNKAAAERRKSRKVEKEKDNLVKLLKKHGVPRDWKK
jgi:hypothetical protein